MCSLFFERFVLFFCLKIERFVPDSAEIWICGLYFSYYENKIVRLFIDGGFGFATTKVKDGGDAINGFEIGLKPGIAIKLNQHFSLVAKCGFLGYKDDYMNNSGFGFSASSEDLTFGFHYEF